jgi:hypothetical protein
MYICKLQLILNKQLNSMLLLESLISVICIFKSMSELMSFVVLFTGQTAEQYVIAGVTNLNYWYFEARTDVVCCIV